MAFELLNKLWVGNDNSGEDYDFIASKGIHTLINMNSFGCISVSTVKRVLTCESPLSSIVDALILCNEENKPVLIYGSSPQNYISIEVFNALIQFLRTIFPSMSYDYLSKCLYSKIPKECWEPLR